MSTVILSTYYNNLSTPRVSLFPDGSETIVDSGTVITESSTIPGQFSFSSARSGVYGILMYSTGIYLGTFWADIPVTGSVTASESKLEVLSYQMLNTINTNVSNVSTFDPTVDKVLVSGEINTLDYLSTTLSSLHGSGNWEGGSVYLSIPSTTVQASIVDNTITIYRGDTLRVSLSDLGDISDRSKLWFTVKRNYKDLDSEAIIQITESSGLQVFSGSSDYSNALASLTVTSPTDATIDIMIDETLTSELSASYNLLWDMQVLESDGIRTFTSGKCNIVNDVTRATS